MSAKTENPNAKQPSDYAISIDTVREQAIAKSGGAGLWFKTAGGFPFFLEYPLLRSREMKKALEGVEDSDAEGIARILLGDEYDEWIAAEGDPDDLPLYFMHLNRDFQVKQQRA